MYMLIISNSGNLGVLSAEWHKSSPVVKSSMAETKGSSNQCVVVYSTVVESNLNVIIIFQKVLQLCLLTRVFIVEYMKYIL